MSGGFSSFVWRFPIAFQIIPLIFLFIIVWAFPESPRWLVKVGRETEARYILGRLRGEKGDDHGLAEAEFQDIRNVAELERSAGNSSSYFHMFWDVMPKKIGGGSSGSLHIGRRVQLVILLQILQEWIGIAGVTIYANDIFQQAGYTLQKSRWIAGINDIFYMFSTLVAVYTLDRLGRRVTLYWGAIVMGISMFLSGGLSRLAIEHPAQAAQYGAASASFTFIFTAAFGATWLTVPWLYPAEIFPLQVRAKGNAWGVVGWSIGNGWTVSGESPIVDRRADECTGPAPAARLQHHPGKDLLRLWRDQRHQHTHRLGSVPGIEPTHARRDGSAVCFELLVELGGREELCST